MLDFLAMMPHGDEVLDPKDNETKNLSELMKKIGESANGIKEFVVVSPHNIRIMDYNSIIFAEHISNGRDFLNDKILAMKIYERAKAENVPVVGVNFGALEGEGSKIPLDWGTSIPLEFFQYVEKIVLISPARKISREKLVMFGKIIAETADNYMNRVGIIISADQAHAHDKNGPYGFSEFAKIYDNYVINAFKNNRIDEILNISDDVIENAKPDSFWQILILIGILAVKKFVVEEIKYACPTYFGMLASKFGKV